MSGLSKSKAFPSPKVILYTKAAEFCKGFSFSILKITTKRADTGVQISDGSHKEIENTIN